MIKKRLLIFSAFLKQKPRLSSCKTGRGEGVGKMAKVSASFYCGNPGGQRFLEIFVFFDFQILFLELLPLLLSSARASGCLNG